MDTLLAPLASPLPSYLEPYRFWIWLQMVAWRLYVRAIRGRGIPFMTVIDRQGTVYLKWIGHRLTKSRKHRQTRWPSGRQKPSAALSEILNPLIPAKAGTACNALRTNTPAACILPKAAPCPCRTSDLNLFLKT